MSTLFIFSIILLHGWAYHAVINYELANKTLVENNSTSRRTVLLENGMTVTLIQDFTVKRSIATLEVDGISAKNDPTDIIGMPRFIEKMIIMSPIESLNNVSFSSFIDGHGGRYEWLVNDSRAVLYFSISHDDFNNALNLLSQALMQPSFYGENVEQQVDEIHTEYTIDSPHHVFAYDRFRKVLYENQTRNFVQLKYNSLWRLHELNNSAPSILAAKFHTEYYLPHSMSLTITSPEALDNINRVVASSFSKMRKRKSVQKMVNPLITEEDFVGKMINIEIPYDGNKKYMLVTFPTPNLSFMTAKGTIEYLTRLIAYREKGSFLRNLRDMIWDVEIHVEISSYTKFYMLTFDFVISTEGSYNMTMVLKSLFEFLAAVKERHNNEEWLYDNMRAERIDIDGIDMTMSESEKMDILFLNQSYNPQSDIEVARSYLLEPDWDQESLEYLLHFLKPDNMQVTVMNMNSGNEFEEPMQINYTISQLDEGLIALLKNVNASADKSEIPKPLDFTNEPLDVHDTDDQDNWWGFPEEAVKETEGNSESEIEKHEHDNRKFMYDTRNPYSNPNVIFEDELKKIWFAREGHNSDQISFRMMIMNDGHARHSLGEYIITNLFAIAMKQTIWKELSDYLWTGLEVQFELYGNAFLLELNGEREKVFAHAQECVSILLDNEIDNRDLEFAKEMLMVPSGGLLNALEHWIKINTRSGVWEQDIKAVILESTLDDIESKRKHLNTGCYIESLIYGDLSEEDALRLYYNATDVFNDRYKTKIPTCYLMVQPTMIIPDGSDYYLETNFVNENDTAAVLVTFQLDLSQSTQKNTAIVLLLQSILDTTKIDGLELNRTTWFMPNKLSIIWLSLHVEGPYNTHVLHSRIEAYIDNITKEYLPRIDYRQFNKFKAILIEKYYEKPQTWQDYVFENLWPTIIENGTFNERQVLAEHTRKIRQKELVEFAKKYIAPGSQYRRKLSIHMRPTNQALSRMMKESELMDQLAKPTRIENIGLFQQEMDFVQL